ncbi:uncharacterized protein LOC113464040 [Ceratina calcarata]|uniref:Uncharacterized protein LOC113464040 n=1 Tax=Ceratina calcarata TaxID=156304 RepID=A0AAJ7W8W7_9HYME|nr:uncharacterized protein LOC113464040 [Ceratina calcarata]
MTLSSGFAPVRGRAVAQELFFDEGYKCAVCVIYRKELKDLKVTNLKRHFAKLHEKEYGALTVDERHEKFRDLKRGSGTPQSTNTELSAKNVQSFPKLKSILPQTLENINYEYFKQIVAELQKDFTSRFEDIKKLELYINITGNPFSVDLSLMTNNEALKAELNNIRYDQTLILQLILYILFTVIGFYILYCIYFYSLHTFIPLFVHFVVRRRFPSRREGRELQRPFPRFGQSRRQKRRIVSLENLLQELREQCQLSSNSSHVIEAITEESVVKEIQTGKVNGQYPPGLRAFALTVNFYSPKAYNYIRQVFQNKLPSPSTIRAWYSTTDGSPGFTKEAIDILKRKSEEAGDKKLYACLTMDEMAIRSQVVWDKSKTKFVGYIDTGIQTENNENLPLAKEALVHLLTGINQRWKIPVAYF